MNTSTSIRKKGYSKIGKEIKKSLIDNDMKALELAYALGMSPQYLNKILHGTRTGEKYLEDIGKILNIEVVAREG